MTNELENVPDLRFPEFKGEWEEKKLSDVGYYSKSYPYSRAMEGEGIIHHIHYGDIHSKLPSKINDINLLPTIVENRDFEFVEKGDIIFADASEDYKDLGKAVLIDIEDNNIIAGLHTHVFRLNPEITAEFLINFTKTLNYYKFIKKQGTGISVLGISKKNLSNLTLNIPAYNEQQKIGRFFSKLDQQIELEEQKLSLLEEQKKGYMQKFFSQELRFKDENDNDYPEWDETTVKEIASISTGNKDTKDAIENGKYEFYVRSPKIHQINSYSFDGEAVLTVGDGVGVGKVFHYVNGKFDYHQRVYKISNFNNYNALLFYYYFSTHFLREAQKYNAKTSVDSVRRDMIINMKIPNIIIEEQEKISNFLSKLDELINKQGQKIDDLKLRKQGFLQKMFV
ncbi:restriction endonuclease subunit S [Staphylococcus equorum]|uniref:restriction endonuclease subunit S n=1 Tax=Staphylococcus equorum TaxID=246432 RepID=UPI003F799A13